MTTETTEPSIADWWSGYAPSGPGCLPVMGRPDCPWCYGSGARSYMPYRYCYCVQSGGSQQGAYQTPWRCRECGYPHNNGRHCDGCDMTKSEGDARE